MTITPRSPSHLLSTFISSPITTTTPRLILLDRDGVINHDVGAPGVLHPSQLILTNNAANAISDIRTSTINNNNCKKNAIITNQSCVGKNLIHEKDLEHIHDILQSMLVSNNPNAIIDKIFYCTSFRNSNNNNDDDDVRMKPNPGMINEACDYFQVNPDECVMIGDAIRDLEAAANAGVPIRILVETGYGLSVMNGMKAPPYNEEEEKMMMVRYIDKEYCEKYGYMNGLNSNNKHLILPFYYTKDLSTASKWLLQNTSISTSR